LVSASKPETLIHQTAKLRGTWVAERTVYLDNRQMNAKVGFFVFTPLRLEGGGVIAIQRGWIPRNFERRDQVPVVQTPAGAVEVVGRIAPPPSKLYQPGSPSADAIRQNLDLEQFRTESGLALLPVTLVQTGAASEGLLRDWPAINLGVEKHYGYAFQWFGLCALIAGLYLWFQIIRPSKSRMKEIPSNVP
jgi:surfeit locus 1 family protein